MEWIAAGLVFGFLGSFHCVGMCEPISLALPGADHSIPYLIFSRLVYNIGRVITYSTLGLAVGLMSSMISISGFQQGLSITVGIIILLGLTISAFRQKLHEWERWEEH